MKDYIAIIYKESDSDFGVSFVDFPGCITASKTIDEAKIMAKEALTGHIRLMQDYGHDIPEPTSFLNITNNIQSHIKEYGDPLYFLVTVNIGSTKPIRINATFDPALLSAIDHEVSILNTTRSGWLSSIAKKELGLDNKL